MTDPISVDAKIHRARHQLRRLKTDISHLRAELASLIIREDDADRELWVYRGGDAKLPAEWSVRVGEFAHNLRSALDHMVWQLAAAHGKCTGRHGSGSQCPGRHNRFPIHSPLDSRSFAKQLCGVNPETTKYIESLQPFPQLLDVDPAQCDLISLGLAALGDICNRDKHRRLLTATVRWTGDPPTLTKDTSRFHHFAIPDYCRLDGRIHGLAEPVSRELRYGGTLLITSDVKVRHRLAFPLDAYFDRSPDVNHPMATEATVDEVLDSCFHSTGVVANRLRQDL